MLINGTRSDTSFDCKDKLVRLEDSISRCANRDLRHVALLEQQRTDLSTISDNVKSLKDISAFMQDPFGDTVASLEKKVDHIPEMSAQQSEDICTLLRAIQGQLSRGSAHLSLSDSIPSREKRSIYTGDGPTNTDDDLIHDDELPRSLERLCQLAQEKQGTKCDEKAQIIIDDLDALLKHATEAFANIHSDSQISRKRPINMTDEESKMGGRDLRRIRGLLISCDSLVVNQPGTRISV